MDNGIKTCCICGKEFEGWGNNPDPIIDKDGNLFPENARCCDECNGMYVIPARIVELDKVYATVFVGCDDEGRPMFETHEAKYVDG